MKKLKISRTTIRNLMASQLANVGGGLNSNLTCQSGCASIYCATNVVSCPANCPLFPL